ncbi:hypothetical protein N7486_007078 [Penicillium sp. IBT 16267x]|nr:hypothetical protein N7486_007078 [Penicillium sp. IBT 16267x]
MPLTLHLLGFSQSERIIWLAEELNIDYKYVLHKRDQSSPHNQSKTSIPLAQLQ